jgi:hypothetical protein
MSIIVHAISFVVVFGGGFYVGQSKLSGKIAAEIKAIETNAVTDVKSVIAAIKKHL